MHKKLYIPGPVEVGLDVMEAMSAPMVGHRMKEYAAVHRRVTDGLKSCWGPRARCFFPPRAPSA